MIEMPEAWTIARQMDGTLTGKTFQHFSRGPLTHKFLWLNKTAEEHDTFLVGKQVSGAKSYGRSISCMLGIRTCCGSASWEDKSSTMLKGKPCPQNITCAGTSPMAPA